MKSVVTILCLTATLLNTTHAQDSAEQRIRWSPGIILGRRSSFDKSGGNYIKYFRTTMTLGSTPNPSSTFLAVWPGLLTENGDLVQSVAVSKSPFDDRDIRCVNRDTQWCLLSYVMDCDPTAQDVGSVNCKGVFAKESVAVDPGTAVDIEYKYDESTSEWLQTMAIDGDIVSSLVTVSGKAYMLEMMTECQSNCYDNAMTIGGYSYTNTAIEFANDKIKEYLYKFNISPPFTEVSVVKLRKGKTRVEVDKIKYHGFYWPAAGARPIDPQPGHSMRSTASLSRRVHGSEELPNLASSLRYEAFMNQTLEQGIHKGA